MTDDKIIKITAKKLQSTKTDEVLFTIKQLRNTGDPRILPFLFELLSTSKSEQIRSSIISLLNDLKDKNCRPEVVKALRNNNYRSIHKEILTTCWQSGLDYSNEIGLFVELFTERDFGVAFEAFTIIDNLEEKVDASILEPIILGLKSNITSFKETDKESLFVELVHILEGLKND
ncbi:MAG: hypothetical protein HC831_11955 [Chloroflexia bacterium]|nr:hypothetical protein [Chloroflexia bacterium]